MRPTIEILDRDSVARSLIRAVAFDFDDTIVRVPVSWQAVMADLFVEVLYPQVCTSMRVRLHTDIKEQITLDSGLSLTAFMERLNQMATTAGIDGVCSTDEYRATFDARWRLAADHLYAPEQVTAGFRDLARGLSECGVDIYVVTGGDRSHKLALLCKLELLDIITKNNLLGDEGASSRRFAKRDALNWIRSTVLCSSDPYDTQVVAMIGDGTHDMSEAKAASALAIGYGQRLGAHVVLNGNGFPALEEFASQIPLESRASRIIRGVQ